MRDGQPVPLAPKTFDLLLVLIESGGRAMSKAELMQSLWPDTFVEEANLSFQISTLRKALGEDGPEVDRDRPEAWVPLRGGPRRGRSKATGPAGPNCVRYRWAGIGCIVAGASSLWFWWITYRGRPRATAAHRDPLDGLSRDPGATEPFARRQPGRLFLERPERRQLRYLHKACRSR